MFLCQEKRKFFVKNLLTSIDKKSTAPTREQLEIDRENPI
jgi:hypothetical protein